MGGSTHPDFITKVARNEEIVGACAIVGEVAVEPVPQWFADCTMEERLVRDAATNHDTAQ